MKLHTDKLTLVIMYILASVMALLLIISTAAPLLGYAPDTSDGHLPPHICSFLMLLLLAFAGNTYGMKILFDGEGVSCRSVFFNKKIL